MKGQHVLAENYFLNSQSLASCGQLSTHIYVWCINVVWRWDSINLGQNHSGMIIWKKTSTLASLPTWNMVFPCEQEAWKSTEFPNHRQHMKSISAQWNCYYLSISSKRTPPAACSVPKLRVWFQRKRNGLHGRMLGYLFFSLFSSLFAISNVPCTYPDVNDWKEQRHRVNVLENKSFWLHMA